MSIPSLLTSLLFAFVHTPMREGTPLPPVVMNEAAAKLPAGKWRVEYANGVTEVCLVNKDGLAIVTDPVRIVGKAAASGSAILMLFENGRAQRWTPVGNRFVVEHWFPGDKIPTTAAGTVGIAERAK
jgi:hypothetical protein